MSVEANSADAGWEADPEEQRLVSEILRDGESLLEMLPEDEAEVCQMN